MILSFDVYGPELGRFKSLTPGYFQAMHGNGFRMAILKSSMGYGIDTGCQDFVKMLKKHFDIAYYHWVDPTAMPKSQAAWLKKQVDTYRPKAIFLDIEQYCEDPFNKRKPLPAQQIVTCANELLDILRPMGLPVEVYHSQWFVPDRCMGTVAGNGDKVTGKGYLSNGRWWRDVTWPWSGSVRPWMAAYVVDKVTKMHTWADFLQFLYSRIQPYSPETWGHTNYFDAGKKVKWLWWQFASKLWLPAFYTLDLSTFNGEETDYQAWIDQTPAEEPDEDPDDELPVLFAYRIKVRGNPNLREGPAAWMKKITMLTAGTEVLVKDENPTNGYVQIVSPQVGWLYAGYIEKV